MRSKLTVLIIYTFITLPALPQSRVNDILSSVADAVSHKDNAALAILDYINLDNRAAQLSALNYLSNQSFRNEDIDISILDHVASHGGEDMYLTYGTASFGAQTAMNRYASYPLSSITSGWGRVTSGYGFREKFNRMHNGIDIAMPVGHAVRVVMPGTVEKVAYENGGYGCYITVRHDNGYETRYAHLSSTLVNAGDYVEADQEIALSGNTGNSTGPHLHFEVRHNGVPVDPATMFDFGGNSSEIQRPALLSGNLADPCQYIIENRITTGLNGSKKQLTTKNTYIVRQGDTLKDIASRAGISVLRLCQLNFITEAQKIPTGTMLRLR